MRVRWVVLIGTSLLTLGLGVGAFLGFDYGVTFWQNFDKTANEARYISDTKTRVILLQALRKGDAKNVTLLLESSLDSDIVGLSVILDKSYDKRGIEKALQMAARYRATTNYENKNAMIADAVRSALKPGRM